MHFSPVLGPKGQFWLLSWSEVSRRLLPRTWGSNTLPRLLSRLLAIRQKSGAGVWPRDRLVSLRPGQFTSTTGSSIQLLHSSLPHSPKCSFLLQAQGPSISCLGVTKMQNNCIAVLSSWVPGNNLPRESHLSLEFYQSSDCSVFYLVSLIRIYTESILQTMYTIMLN